MDPEAALALFILVVILLSLVVWTTYTLPPQQ